MRDEIEKLLADIRRRREEAEVEAALVLAGQIVDFLPNACEFF